MGALVKPGSIGSILLNSQIITEADIAAALEEQQKNGCRIGEALVRLGIVAQEDIDWALSNQLNIPYVRLKREMIDRSAVDLLPGYICRQYGLMPIIRYGSELSVAMIDPLNTVAIEAVQELTGCTVTVSVALVRELREMQALFYGPLEDGDALGFASSFFPTEALARINIDLTGAILIDYLLGYMVQQRLASLSLQPLENRCQVVARKRGAAREIGSLPLDRYSPIQLRLRRMAGLDDESNGDRGRLAFHYKEAQLDIQGHFLRMVGGDCITLRRQLTAPFPASLAEFLTTEGDRALMGNLTSLECGIILFLAGEKDDLNRTIDFCLDEMAHRGKGVAVVGQGLGRGRSHFPRVESRGEGAAETAALLSALLEHEPDVIAIEDAGDEALLHASGKAALRGRLVAAGLPGHDLTTVFRYLGHLWRHHHFIPAYLKGIVNCRSVRLLCRACRQSYLPSAEELAAMGLVEPPHRFYRATGCRECGQSGHETRKYLLEVIDITPELLRALERSGDGRGAVEVLNARGTTGIRAQGIGLLDRGDVSPQEFISALVL